MTVLLSVLLGILTLALETFLGAAFGLDLWTPPLFTVFVLWLASSPIRTSDFIIVASLGLFADGLASSPAGTHGLMGMVLLFLLPLLTSRLQLNRGVGAAAFGVVGALISLVMTAVVARETGSAGVASRMGELFIPQLVTLGCGAPLLFPVFDALSKSRMTAADADAL
jgi:hypothetical protein